MSLSVLVKFLLVFLKSLPISVGNVFLKHVNILDNLSDILINFTNIFANSSNCLLTNSTGFEQSRSENAPHILLCIYFSFYSVN